jgi:hypothetical protein
LTEFVYTVLLLKVAEHGPAVITNLVPGSITGVCTHVCVQALEERDRLQQQMQQVSHLQQQLAAAAAEAAESAALAAEFQEKFIRERAVRRRLHEQLQVRAACLLMLCGIKVRGVASCCATF